MGCIAVTGSQSGIGLAIRKRLEASGQRVVGIDLPGKNAEVQADLSTPQGRRNAVRGVLDLCDGELNGTVISATLDTGDAGRMIEVNYFGAVDFLDGVRGVLAASRPACAVVNLSSSTIVTSEVPAAPVEALLAGDPEKAAAILKAGPAAAYRVSIFALARWVRRNAATRAWAGEGISLNGVCPGPVMTPAMERDLHDPVKGAAILNLPRPLDEFMPPDAVAYLVEFLLSQEARFIVGQLVMVDGGIEAARCHEEWPAPPKPL